MPQRPMFVTSVAIHVVLLVLLPLLLADFGRSLRTEPKRTNIVFYRPPAPTPLPAPTPAPAPKVERPRPTPRRPTPVPQKPAPPIEKPVEVARDLPRVETRTVPIVPRPTPPPTPRPQVRSAGFAEAATTAAPPKPSTREIRTAGFGVTSAPTAAPAAPTYRGSARVGGFEVPRAPEPQSPAQAPRGRVASTGFDKSAGEAPAPAAPQAHAPVSTGGFGDTVAVAPTPTRHAEPQAQAPSPDTPVEILSKPKPIYTTAAREKRVEGEVVLEVVFGAAGRLRVLRVVRGLGFGLDEAAAEAARQITFEPARRSGAPIDHTAVLRIVFQLA